MHTTHGRQDWGTKSKFCFKGLETQKSPATPNTSYKDRRKSSNKVQTKANYKSMKTQGTKNRNIPQGDTGKQEETLEMTQVGNTRWHHWRNTDDHGTN